MIDISIDPNILKSEYYHSHYSAKFAREEKKNPLDWIISHSKSGIKLIFIGDKNETCN